MDGHPSEHPDLLDHACSVVEQNTLGLLCTSDKDGVPHARYMEAIADERLTRVFTLTGEGSRKTLQIEATPEVCWVFADKDKQNVVTLHGRAKLHTEPGVLEQADWDRLLNAIRQYTMNVYKDATNVSHCLIETTVLHGELLSPALDIFCPTEFHVPTIAPPA